VETPFGDYFRGEIESFRLNGVYKTGIEQIRENNILHLKQRMQYKKEQVDTIEKEQKDCRDEIKQMRQGKTKKISNSIQKKQVQPPVILPTQPQQQSFSVQPGLLPLNYDEKAIKYFRSVIYTLLPLLEKIMYAMRNSPIKIGEHDTQYVI
jgi:hypothetical protein